MVDVYDKLLEHVDLGIHKELLYVNGKDITKEKNVNNNGIGDWVLKYPTVTITPKNNTDIDYILNELESTYITSNFIKDHTNTKIIASFGEPNPYISLDEAKLGKFIGFTDYLLELDNNILNDEDEPDQPIRKKIRPENKLRLENLIYNQFYKKNKDELAQEDHMIFNYHIYKTDRSNLYYIYVQPTVKLLLNALENGVEITIYVNDFSNNNNIA